MFNQPDFFVNLGFKELADREAEKKGIPSIGFFNSSTFQIFASEPSIDISFFYLSFFLRLSTNWFKKKNEE